MTIEQQAEAILEKYTILLSLNKVQVELIEDSAIQCAITEVEAIISSNPHSNPLNTNPAYSTMQEWFDTLKHLKQM
jgi:hypothetical protein